MAEQNEADTRFDQLLALTQDACAARHSPTTSSTLAGQRTALHVVLQVRDTGSGIPARAAHHDVSRRCRRPIGLHNMLGHATL